MEGIYGGTSHSDILRSGEFDKYRYKYLLFIKKKMLYKLYPDTIILATDERSGAITYLQPSIVEREASSLLEASRLWMEENATERPALYYVTIVNISLQRQFVIHCRMTAFYIRFIAMEESKNFVEEPLQRNDIEWVSLPLIKARRPINADVLPPVILPVLPPTILPPPPLYNLANENDMGVYENQVIYHEYNDITPALIQHRLNPESTYHSFFQTFCEIGMEGRDREKIELVRRVLLEAGDTAVLQLHLTTQDQSIIRNGSYRQLCTWMLAKQKERCQPCHSDKSVDIEPFTQLPVTKIPLLFLYIHQNRYCFDIVNLYHYLQISQVNPFNRDVFSNIEIDKIRQSYNLISELIHKTSEN